MRRGQRRRRVGGHHRGTRLVEAGDGLLEIRRTAVRPAARMSSSASSARGQRRAAPGARSAGSCGRRARAAATGRAPVAGGAPTRRRHRSRRASRAASAGRCAPSFCVSLRACRRAAARGRARRRRACAWPRGRASRPPAWCRPHRPRVRIGSRRVPSCALSSPTAVGSRSAARSMRPTTRSSSVVRSAGDSASVEAASSSSASCAAVGGGSSVSAGQWRRGRHQIQLEGVLPGRRAQVRHDLVEQRQHLLHVGRAVAVVLARPLGQRRPRPLGHRQASRRIGFAGNAREHRGHLVRELREVVLGARRGVVHGARGLRVAFGARPVHASGRPASPAAGRASRPRRAAARRPPCRPGAPTRRSS